jgi:Tfp pilus assembly protein PilO
MNLESIKSKIDLKNPKVLGIIISIILFIVIIGVYYYFIYSGLKSKEAQKQNALNAATAKYNSYLTLARSYPLILKQDKKLSKEFAGLLLELPSKKNIPQLLMKISNYEKVLNLNLNMFKPDKGMTKGFYETVPFSMNISGNFYNVYKFFYKLASMKRIVDVHGVSISKKAKDGNVSVSFQGTTFSFIGAVKLKSPVKPAQRPAAVKKP